MSPDFKENLVTSNMTTFFSGMPIYADRILDKIPVCIEEY